MSTTTTTEDASHQRTLPKRLQAQQGAGLNIKMTTLTLFGPIGKHRVNEKQPPRQIDELDVDRCAAMHNTLLLFGWVCSGKKIPALEKRSWWSRHGTPALKQTLRPSVVRYLSKIFDVPGHNLFYHISGLANPSEMLQLGDVLDDHRHGKAHEERHRFIVIYNSSKAQVSHPAGIVYDQQRHMAILMPTYNHILDLKSDTLPWQKLETILSAYIDMIEAEKAVAVHDTVGEQPGAVKPETEIHMGPDRVQNRNSPWVLQAYTKGDLENCLDVWKKLIHAIESRIKAKNPAAQNVAGEDEEFEPLCSRTALNVANVTHGFAYDLLSHAQNSRLWFVAPGIRLPKVEEFLNQPFKKVAQQFPVETSGMKMPFLFLRTPGEVSAKDAKFRYPFSTVEKVPCGLYLDAFPNAQNPFEDACRLVLPIKLGGNRYARTSDFKPILKTYSDLYQVGVNPFVMRHGPKLVGILENWLENVERGHWSVNEKGVEGGVGIWREADTRENWWRYQTKHLFI